MPLRSVLRASVLLLTCLGLWACDGTGSERASQYQRLVGTWTLTRLQVDGFDVTTSLNGRYAAVTVEFRTDDTRGRTYRLRGTAPDGSDLEASGPVQVVGANALTLDGGFAQRVFWTFDIRTSRRATLVSPEDRAAGTTAFLQRLLPSQSWGDAQRVEMTLDAADTP